MTSVATRLAYTLLLLASAASLDAQRDRISLPVNPTRQLPLTGNIRPSSLLRNDRGPVDGTFPLPALTLFLKLSPVQQADLDQLLDSQRNAASPLYHRWLTPQQYAGRFGLSPNDTAVITRWLRSQNLTVINVAASRRWIVFSGTSAQVEGAFHPAIHRYTLAGKTHFANSVEPTVPEALSGVVSGLDGLDDFTPDPVNPEMTSATGVHTLAPDDLATIYDIASVYGSGIDGTGQKIAVVGTTQFNASALADVAMFRSRFSLPPNVPQTMHAAGYPDPGVNANSINEAHLDVEWSGAIARNAQIVFVYADTFLHAVQYAVDSAVAPVITMSANNGCEAQNTPANMSFYQSVAQQANTEGITWIVSGSDAGPASCDPNGGQAMSGLAVRFPASIPEVTSVGGTEFDEQSGATYWNATNTPAGASALSYIPEMVWNDALALNALWAGGGGVSTYFLKPSWQAGPGVPNDNARDVPDIALAASFSHDGYTVIRNGATVVTGGTSASAPVFAGILALLNQYLVTTGAQAQPGLGNVNAMLYPLAAAANGAFHDITLGNNTVPCVSGSPNCPNGTMGFTAGPGYDLASGLGSIDVSKFLDKWNTRPALPPPVIFTKGIVPVDGAAAIIEPGEWVSLYGTNLAASMTVSNGSFPLFLGGTSVTIDGKPAYLSFVSPGQINVQAPDDTTIGPVQVTVTTAGGTAATQVTLGQYAPSFLLLDSTHVAGIILRFNGTGAYGKGTYDILGPTGNSLGYPTVAAKAGDLVELYGTGFGPTSPAVPSGHYFSGAAPTTSPVSLQINNTILLPSFAGLSGAGLDQINLTIPPNLGSGDVSLAAAVGGAQTPTGVVISLQ